MGTWWPALPWTCHRSPLPSWNFQKPLRLLAPNRQASLCDLVLSSDSSGIFNCKPRFLGEVVRTDLPHITFLTLPWGSCNASLLEISSSIQLHKSGRLLRVNCHLNHRVSIVMQLHFKTNGVTSLLNLVFF